MAVGRRRLWKSDEKTQPGPPFILPSIHPSIHSIDIFHAGPGKTRFTVIACFFPNSSTVVIRQTVDVRCLMVIDSRGAWLALWHNLVKYTEYITREAVTDDFINAKLDHLLSLPLILLQHSFLHHIICCTADLSNHTYICCSFLHHLC